MKGLRIETDFQTGWRAGNINPKDPNLACHPQWQDTEQGVEIRLVVDGDVAKYRDVSGVEVLEDEAAIDEAVEALPCNCAEPTWAIANEALMMESIRQKEISLKDVYDSGGLSDVLRELDIRGALGIVRTKPPKPCCASRIARRWQAKD